MRAGLSRFLFSAIAIIAAQGFFLAAARAQTRIARSGATTLSTMSPKGEARVTIQTAIFGSKCKCSCPAAWALKELMLKEISIVQGLEISVGGKRIFSPDSVYDHLFDPREASLRFEGETFVLRIDGMDASNSYFVLIYFDRSGVNRLVTYWSLAPDKPTSETRYFRVEFPWK